MKKNTKAFLLSALAFPGAGQLYLKRYKSACFFIGVTLFATVYIFMEIVTIASVIINKVVAGELAGEYLIIRKAIFEAQANSGSQIITILIYVLIATWLVSIIDILRLKNK